MNIVSLLPSATEIICALGLRDQLVGITHACDYPQSVTSLPAVTRTVIPKNATSREIDELVRERLEANQGLYLINQDLLSELDPAVIVTQTLCEVCAVTEEEVNQALCRLGTKAEVVNLQPHFLKDVFDNILQVAASTGTQKQALELITSLQQRVDAVVANVAKRSWTPRTVLLEWLDPPFSCGHWSPELVRLAGGVEGFGKEGMPSKTLDWPSVITWQPEVIFIACCGFDEERTLTDLQKITQYKGWQQVPAIQNQQLFITDGAQYFSRPSHRLVDSLEILAHTLHPDVQPHVAGAPLARQVVMDSSTNEFVFSD